MALAAFSDFFSRIPYVILAFIAYVIYILGSTLASYLVCKRASSKHLMVGLKLTGLAWFFSLIMMLGSTTVPTPTLAIILLVCYGVGGIAGGYLALRSELGSRKIIQDRELPE
jgi:putative membrane protein (TIGR04086 family)